VGPRASLDRCEKYPPPPPGFDPRTIQPVASRYKDYVTRPTPWEPKISNIGKLLTDSSEYLQAAHSHEFITDQSLIFKFSVQILGE
jgi:hypothetical protein